jgi:hypothetical protein
VIRSLSHSLKTISSIPIWTLVIVLATTPITRASEAAHSTEADLSTLAMSRDYYLNDLIQPHRYTPGKNSFLFQTLHLEQRKTVLNLAGRGSVRHLWSTWSIPGSDVVATGRVLLRVFVDKQPSPSIVGTVDELCRAAEATDTQFVPFPASIYKDAYNFYLPIYFKNGIRIEVEALDEIDEFYTQIDYRLDRNEEQFTRLVSESNKTDLILKYTGGLPLSLSKRNLAVVQLSHASADLHMGSQVELANLR